MIKAIVTKAPLNGGFAFVWLNIDLSSRLQRLDLFLNVSCFTSRKSIFWVKQKCWVVVGKGRGVVAGLLARPSLPVGMSHKQEMVTGEWLLLTQTPVCTERR